MYLVTFRTIIGMYNVIQHETLDEAKERAINLIENGYREVRISQ